MIEREKENEQKVTRPRPRPHTTHTRCRCRCRCRRRRRRRRCHRRRRRCRCRCVCPPATTLCPLFAFRVYPYTTAHPPQVRGKDKQLGNLLPSIAPHFVARYPPQPPPPPTVSLVPPSPPASHPYPNRQRHPLYPARAAVFDEQVSWEKPWEDYAPTHFEAEVLAKNIRGMATGGGWADPAEIGPELTEVIRKRLTFENGGQIRRGAGPNCYLPLGSPRVAAYISASYAVRRRPLGSRFTSRTPHAPRRTFHYPLPAIFRRQDPQGVREADQPARAHRDDWARHTRQVGPQPSSRPDRDEVQPRAAG